MENILKICLAKKVLIFYAVLAPFIIFGSLYNLIQGVILHATPTYRVGLFSLLGFVVMPFLLIVTYVKNKSVITSDRMVIGKTEYKFSDYDFQIREKELPLKDRPLTSLLKKNYHDLVIKQLNTNTIVLEQPLDIFQKDLEHMRSALPLRA